MGTQVYFNGRLRKLPGAYSRITSGEQNSPANLDYGKVLVIDTGLGANWGGGAGIDGELSSGKDSVYQFTDLESYRAFLKGGLLWKVAEKLFFPQPGVNGVSTIYHVKAAATESAQMTFTATGGGLNGGTFKIFCKDEGIIGNGAATSTHLDKGYAFTVEAGVIDTAKWIFKIWQGNWKGNHTDNLSYDKIAKANTIATLVVASPEFNNIAELISWATTDQAFGTRFQLDATSAVAGTGTITAPDVPAGYTLAAGGTETYDAASLTLVFEAVRDLDYQFILCDKYGSDYSDADVTSIVNHIKDSATSYIKTMFIGGYSDESNFATSITAANSFNTNRVVLVHGDIKETTELLASGYRQWPTIYHAATILGRVCGLPPQVPVTNKLIAVDGVVHNLKIKEQERAIDEGVLVTVQDYARGGFKVLQGINTLQENTVLFNAEGQSHSIQFERITAQINRELVVNSQTDLLNRENGVNVNTLSPGLLKTWTETYLQSRVASVDSDNLLLSFRNVTVTRVDDYYNVSYGIVINNEINKIFYTGFIFKS